MYEKNENIMIAEAIRHSLNEQGIMLLFFCVTVVGGGGEVKLHIFVKKKPSSLFNYYKRMT